MAEGLALCAACAALGCGIGIVLGLGLAYRWRMLRRSLALWTARRARRLRFNEGGGYRMFVDRQIRILVLMADPYGKLPERMGDDPQIAYDGFGRLCEAYQARKDRTCGQAISC